MPRLRRAARQRRERPQIAAGLWEWVRGAKGYNELPEENKWDWLILSAPLRGSSDTAEFWKRVRRGVANGTIQVSPDKQHYMSDAPLVELPQRISSHRNDLAEGQQ
jgi:hypothetical protein